MKPMLPAIVLVAACSSAAPPAATKPAPPPPPPPPAAPAPMELAFEQQVTFSPDGVWLVFSRRIIDRARWEAEKYKALGGTQYDLYVVRTDGTGLRQLTHTPESETWVAWSPNGRSIAYSVEADKASSISVMNADGSGGHRVVSDASAPAWSPDGKRLAFMRKVDDHLQVFTCAADGSDENQVTNGDVGYAHPQWSPDGAWLVTQSDRKGQGKEQVARISAGGSRTTYITDDENNNFYPSFTPDGKAIAFTSERDGTQNVYVARGTAPPERVIQDAWLARWSPKGDRIAYIAGTFPDSAIYVRDATGADVRRVAD